MSLLLIAIGHVLALTAAAWQAMTKWGPMEGGPTWQWETPAAIVVTWLLAEAMLVSAWRAARGRSTHRSNLIGLAASALGVSIWFQEFYQTCWGPCRAQDDDSTWLSVIMFAAPTASMTLGCFVLLAVLFWSLWKSGQTDRDGRLEPVGSVSDPTKIQGNPSSLRPASAWIAVLLGAAVGNGIGVASSFLLQDVAGALLIFLGYSPEGTYRTLVQAPGILLPTLLVTTVAYAVGGYTAARLSAAAGLRNAVLAGLILTLLNLLASFRLFEVPVPWWMDLTGVLMPVPAYWMGAWIERQRRIRETPL